MEFIFTFKPSSLFYRENFFFCWGENYIIFFARTATKIYYYLITKKVSSSLFFYDFFILLFTSYTCLIHSPPLTERSKARLFCGMSTWRNEMSHIVGDINPYSFFSLHTAAAVSNPMNGMDHK